MIIEVGGTNRNNPKVWRLDKKRQDKLEEIGFTILRFTNQNILRNTDSVCRKMDEEIALLETKGLD